MARSLAHPLLLLAALLAAAAQPLLAQPGRQVPSVPLQCRLDGGPWQPCILEVEQPGERWTIVVAKRRIAFRHDGSGTVRMRDLASQPVAEPQAAQAWQPVETTWIAGPALCWNGVCAQGDIPLD